MITGEYAVLDGALSLALPTKYGQSLSVQKMDTLELRWRSLGENGKIWFEGTFDLTPSSTRPFGQSFLSPYLGKGRGTSTKESEVAETLSTILREAEKMNPEFLSHTTGYMVETRLSFPRNWGLGSSSTLINNIAQWAEVDAYQLLWNAFSGSGYDIACAQRNHPISYRLNNGEPIANRVDFFPRFQDQLYFIHLNKKQNSRAGIVAYRNKDFDKALLTERVSAITRKTIVCQRLSEFESLMIEHERLLSQTLGRPTVKEVLFPDFKGTIKSLGAWGGDFVLATGIKRPHLTLRTWGIELWSRMQKWFWVQKSSPANGIPNVQTVMALKLRLF